MRKPEDPKELALTGHRVAVAGRLATLSRRDLEQLVERLGGSYAPRVDQETTVLVLGEGSWPLTRQGRMHHNLRRLLRQTDGKPSPEILQEREFLARIGGLSSPLLLQRYTLRDVAHLAGLSCRRLQAWIERGWIVPASSSHGIDLFDYQAVARMRQLSKLLAGGVPPARLARSLRLLSRWRSDAQHGLAQLSLLAGSRRLLTRLADGRLVEPGGQLLLPLEETPEETSVAWTPQVEEDLAERAWELEQQERYAEAAEAYQRALGKADSDAQLWLNYGNVLYALGRVPQAADAFRRAANLQRTFAAAWNNLGAACLDLARFEEAEAALRRALAIDESYEDARENLADLLRECGRGVEADKPTCFYLVQ